MKELYFFCGISIAALAFSLSSCTSPIFSLSDTQISVDGSGHVTETVTYTVYPPPSPYVNQSTGQAINTYTYNTDGSYEFVTKTFDG